MHNLHQLLHMPVGCGEQVMSAFAPDIFVANYLTATNQLTSDIKDRALIYMEKGKHKSFPIMFVHTFSLFDAFNAFHKRQLLLPLCIELSTIVVLSTVYYGIEMKQMKVYRKLTINMICTELPLKFQL